MTAFDVLIYIGISRVTMRSFPIGLPQESVERKVMRTHDPNGYLQEGNMLRIRPQKMESDTPGTGCLLTRLLEPLPFAISKSFIYCNKMI